MEWNNDGKKDLLVGRDTIPVEFYLNNNTDASPRFDGFDGLQVGGVPFTSVAAGVRGAGPSVVDWNNDGKLDLVIGVTDVSSSQDWCGVALLLNTGSETSPVFASSSYIQSSGTEINTGPFCTTAVLDWDHDGKKDLLVRNSKGRVYFYRNTGTDASPAFSGSQPIMAGNAILELGNSGGLAVVDWDNDGYEDLLLGDATGVTYFHRIPDTIPFARAGADRVVTDTDGDGSASVTLDAGESSDADGSIVSYVWVEDALQIATGATPVVELAVGTHDLTLTVTDNDGLTNSDAMTVTVLPMHSQEYVLMPDADATALGGSYADSNRGDREWLDVGVGWANYPARVYLRFDIGDRAATTSLVKLRLYQKAAGAAGIEVGWIADDSWQEMGITWNNAPPIGATPMWTFEPTEGNFIELDITAAVQQQTNGMITLYLDCPPGSPGQYNDNDFPSRENPDPSKRPALLLYAPNMPPSVYAGPAQVCEIGVNVQPWTPSFLPATAWYDATYASSEDGFVTEWQDRSGNGYHAPQDLSYLRPRIQATGLNGRPVVVFDGGDQSLPISGSFSMQNLFMVLNSNEGTTFGGGDYLFGRMAPPYFLPFYTGWGSTRLRANDSAYLDGVASGTNCVDFAPLSAYKVVGAMMSSESDVISGMAIGHGWNGGVAELIATSGTMITQDRQRVEGFLAHKWGLAARLPENHPYKGAAPTLACFAAIADLDATVSDADNDPLTTSWSVVEGPGPVIFSDLFAEDTTATFTVPGTYTLCLTAGDGNLQTNGNVVITVTMGASNRVPPVVTCGAGGVPQSETSAMLDGVLTSGGLADAWFCWGTTDGGTTSTSAWENVVSMGLVGEGFAFSNLVTDLSTNTTYFYRCYTENPYGSDWSDTVASFSGRPVVEGGGPVAGADIYLDAGLDDGINGTWEDELAAWNVTLDAGVNYVADAGSSRPGITAAYDFPGGSSGAGGGAGTSFGSMGGWDAESVTLEIWFKPDSTNDDGQVNGQVLWETGGGTGLGIFYNDGDVEVGHDETEVIGSVDVSSLADEFIQVVLTYDESTFLLYVNGVFSASGNKADTDWSGTDGAGLGARGGSNVGGRGSNDASTESFEGQIAIFLAYRNQILSPDQVMSNYSSIAGLPPAVANQAPTSMGDSSATLCAALDASGANYDVYVYYGTSDGGANAAAWETNAYVGSWTDVATNVSYSASGLLVGTACYYTFMVSNATEESWASPSWTFTTLTPPPSTTNYSLPHAWLASAVPGSESDYEAAALADPDGDGFLTGIEYWCGTDPLDGESYLKIGAVVSDGEQVTLYWQHAKVDTSIPPIVIQGCTSLPGGGWTRRGTKAPAEGTNSWSVSGPAKEFYRLSATVGQ